MKQKLLFLTLVFLPFFANGQNITLSKDGIKIDSITARNDLEKDYAKDSYLFLDSIQISEQQQQLAEKDTIISEQSKTISELNTRNFEVTTMFVMSEKELKKERRGRKIFKTAFCVMCVVSFIFGVN